MFALLLCDSTIGVKAMARSFCNCVTEQRNACSVGKLSLKCLRQKKIDALSYLLTLTSC